MDEKEINEQKKRKKKKKKHVSCARLYLSSNSHHLIERLQFDRMTDTRCDGKQELTMGLVFKKLYFSSFFFSLR